MNSDELPYHYMLVFSVKMPFICSIHSDLLRTWDLSILTQGLSWDLLALNQGWTWDLLVLTWNWTWDLPVWTSCCKRGFDSWVLFQHYCFGPAIGTWRGQSQLRQCTWRQLQCSPSTRCRRTIKVGLNYFSSMLMTCISSRFKLSRWHLLTKTMQLPLDFHSPLPSTRLWEDPHNCTSSPPPALF